MLGDFRGCPGGREPGSGRGAIAGRENLVPQTGIGPSFKAIELRDAAFSIFRSERLERYNLFDLAATYTYLAAKAFDYETGLLGTEEGATFVECIIASRALGVVKDGQPWFAASNTGEPACRVYWPNCPGMGGSQGAPGYQQPGHLWVPRFRYAPKVTAFSLTNQGMAIGGTF